MKNILLIIICCISLSSCSRVLSPPYTKVESMMQLKPGMTIEQTNQALGIPPYDIYHMQKDGTTVLMYHYKRQQRSVISTDAGNIKSLTSGKSIFTDPSVLLVIFDQTQQLQSFFSAEGKINSPYLLKQEELLKRFPDMENKDLRKNTMLITPITQEKSNTTTVNTNKKVRKYGVWVGAVVAAYLIVTTLLN